MQHHRQVVVDLEKEMQIWRKRCEYEGKTISKKLVQVRGNWTFHRHEIIDIKVSNEIMYGQNFKTISSMYTYQNMSFCEISLNRYDINKTILKIKD